ncbi:DDE Tnp4 domain-containing protein [Aphis craccivora]|uniref:DDE Tnp4 domain-containing protein n=1 Tax=Aphis craccivora TaxID=307492 RepID=A0A6G0VR71_APHCR|nr:DDE Tnp4 domain-containing protein [Aphis craccivora]
MKIPPPSILQVPYAIKIPYVILADKAFSLNEYTMKPFKGEPARGSQERIFNYRLSRGRRVVVNDFGILSSVFRVLRKPMLLEPKTVNKIVLTTIHLHNYLRKKPNTQSLYTPPGSLDSETDGELRPGTWRNEPAPTSLLLMPCIPRKAGNYVKEIRSHLAHHFVTNGEIPRQNRY